MTLITIIILVRILILITIVVVITVIVVYNNKKEHSAAVIVGLARAAQSDREKEEKKARRGEEDNGERANARARVKTKNEREGKRTASCWNGESKVRPARRGEIACGDFPGIPALGISSLRPIGKTVGCLPLVHGEGHSDIRLRETLGQGASRSTRERSRRLSLVRVVLFLSLFSFSSSILLSPQCLRRWLVCLPAILFHR